MLSEVLEREKKTKKSRIRAKGSMRLLLVDREALAAPPGRMPGFQGREKKKRLPATLDLPIPNRAACGRRPFCEPSKARKRAGA